MEEKKPQPATIPFAQASVKPPLTPQEAREPHEKTVTMTFPRKVRVTTRDGLIDFPAGVQEVPEHLADHPYLKHSGVKRHATSSNKSGWQKHADDNLEKDATQAQMTEHHVDFLRSRGYRIEDAAQAQRFYDNLPADNQPGFLEEAAAHRPDSEYEKQRRVQDAEAGYEHAAPPNPKQADGTGGPEPAIVGDLVDEGVARSVTEEQAGSGTPNPNQPVVAGKTPATQPARVTPPATSQPKQPLPGKPEEKK